MKGSFLLSVAVLVAFLSGCTSPPPPSPPAPGRSYADPIDMVYAVRTGDWEAVKRLAATRPSLVDVLVERRYSPLYLAARAGRADVVKVLLENKADINFITGSWNWTPLHAAAASEEQSVAVARLLVEAGAEIMKPAFQGTNALFVAAKNNRHKIVDFFLSRGADMYAVDDNNRTVSAVTIALNLGHVQTVAVMIKHGFKANGGPDDPDPPLHIAATGGYAELVALLLKKGADVRRLNSMNETALHTAAYGGRTGVMEVLVAAGADVNATAGDGGGTPLHEAAKAWKNAAGAVELLLAHGADVAAKDGNGSTPLHRAASAGNPLAAAYLLAYGADVRARNEDGLTPIQMAEASSARNSEETVQILRDAAKARKKPPRKRKENEG